MRVVRRTLIAGGLSTVGLAVARELAGRGDKVVITGRDPRMGAAAVAELGVDYVACDLADADGRATLAREAGFENDELDGLVVALGALHTARLSETTDGAWDAVLDANLITPFLVAQSCLPLLRDGGAIVFIGSGVADWPEMELGAYSVAKRMVTRMVQVLAMEAALRDIRVNVINPGEMDMPMSAMAAAPLRAIPPTPVPPLGRRAEAEDVATAVAFFLSENSAFCTGAALTVDGGVRAALRAHRVRQ